MRRRASVSEPGACSGDHAGMSNDKAGENPAHRKSKVSWARFVPPGSVGP